MDVKEYKIEIYIPEKYIPELRDSLNKIGACSEGNYDHIVSYSEVKGYWQPLEDADPYNGKQGEINFGSECKMEIRCRAHLIEKALRLIYQLHPYEEPLINIVPLMNSFFTRN